MFAKMKFYLIIFISLALILYLFPVQNIVSYIKYEFYSKDDLKISLKFINPEIKSLSSEPSNRLVLRVEVRSSKDMAIPKAHIHLSAVNNIGSFTPSDARTDRNGECLVTYSPPRYNPQLLKKARSIITLTAGIYKTNISSSVSIELKPVPIIFVHGYQGGAYNFDNLKEYLAGKGFQGTAMNYKSENGVIEASKKLTDFIRAQKALYLSKGMQVEKFDIIAHSMGGLVARYYTSSEEYIRNNDVEKIIFISVPQRGSPWASLGTNYFNDQGMKDLIPDNPLLIHVLPNMINKGLNNYIEIGSIMDQYDEVVSPESASLEEWAIKTDVFNVGESTLTMDNLLSGNIMYATNHNNVLSNKKVFEKIADMLALQLPYPTVKNNKK